MFDPNFIVKKRVNIIVRSENNNKAYACLSFPLFQ